MKKLLPFFVSMAILCTTQLSSQNWEATASFPEGGGVTDLLVRESNGHLFAVTGSYNWPNGDMGGLRRSTDNGDTWTNLKDTYTGRAIIEGPDGELLASIWEYPQNEGLYRSYDNGDTWQQLVNVPSGNNIFSIAVHPGDPNIIYAGTRTGVYRSLDNGSTWAYANNGMPSDAWVRGLDVDPDGVVAAGTTQGLYISSDNGDNWDIVTGDGIENDTIVSVKFDVVPGSAKDENQLYAGNAQGVLFLATVATFYLVATQLYNFGYGKEITRTVILRSASALFAYYFVSLYAAFGGEFYTATVNPNNWLLFMDGMLPLTLVSIFAAHLVGQNAIMLFLGTYDNTANGAKVYKNTVSVQSGIEDGLFVSEEVFLGQNKPNPVDRYTTIDFVLPAKKHVSIKLFDMNGRELRTLLDKELAPGKHNIGFSRENLAPGLYYYVLSAGDESMTKKLLIK